MQDEFNDDLLENDEGIIDEEDVDDGSETEDLDLSSYFNNEQDKDPEPSQNDPDDSSDDNQPSVSSDYIGDFLKLYGIEDPSKLQFQDDEGNVTEMAFDSLSNEEKLNILKDLTDPGFTDYEIDVINYLRANNATLDDVAEFFKQQGVNEYLSQNPDAVHQKTYTIDEYSDDELYLGDLKNKYPEFSDEELMSKLESAKLNEDLFTKEVTALRESYKQQEEDYLAEQEAQAQQDYINLQNNLQQLLIQFNEIPLDTDDPTSGALQVEDTDKDRMMRYLIERDSNGKSQLIKDLEDPNALIELAYYRTCERNNINGLTRYWKQQLAEERKDKAKLQKEIDRLKNKGNNSSVVTPRKPASGKNERVKIADIWG